MKSGRVVIKHKREAEINSGDHSSVDAAIGYV
jgi:hypothetical protein